MNPHLRDWLLDGVSPPDGVDLDALLASHEGARALADDLLAIDAAALGLPPIPPTTQVSAAFEHRLESLFADLDAVDIAAGVLPPLAPPEALNQAVLNAVDALPRLPSSLGTAPHIPKPANQVMRWVVGVAVAAAAVMLAIVPGTPTVDPGLDTPYGVIGTLADPTDITPKGVEDPLGPKLELSMAVLQANGSVERFSRGDAYAAGTRVGFHYDSLGQGWLHLVRVDASGATLLHIQHVDAGSGELEAGVDTLVYELELGESAAVFALIRHDNPLTASDIADGLAVGADAGTLCQAARVLGARCAAEQVEAVQ